MSTQTAEAGTQPVLRKISKFSWTMKEIKKNKAAYAMVFPFFILFFIFTVIPVLLSVVISFTTFNMLEFPEWVFMDNYIRLLLDDDIFLLAIKNTIVFAAITGPGSYLLCLFFAWFINELRPKIRSIVTLIFYAPSIAGNAYLVFTILFSGDQYGLVNGMLMDMNIINSPILWFQDTDYIFPLIIVVALWTSLGTSFLSFIAGFQVVNRELYEAGAVDGIKNRWQELWYITLPSMKPQLMFGAVMAITGAFGFGGIVTALAGNPSVDYVAYTLTHHLEEYQNNRWEVGYASAISFILFLMMIGSNVLITKLISKLGE